MRSIFFLSIKEIEKIINKKTILIPVFLILAISIFSGVITYSNIPSGLNWKESLNNAIIEDEKLLEEAKNMGESDKYTSKIEAKVVADRYYLENNINPNNDSFLDFINEHAGLTTIISIFVIIYASGIMVNEFNWGTITFLSIKPFSRSKLFLGKYLALIILILGLYLLLLISLLLVGIIIYGFNSIDLVNMIVKDGEVIKQNVLLSIFKKYTLSLVPSITFITMAYMISIITKNSIVPTAVSLGCLMFGGTLTKVIQGQPWSKFVLFTNTDLTGFITGAGALSSETTLLFAILVNLTYTMLFIIIPLSLFKKRDIA
ncbi:hypothetical protein GPDM_01000 [Planococcus donghaensis MPA1U2]|uniref:Uncharacterized protein n=1 Tax=Planococcus donghaensis MPA1U2 TaxID=933115 RepID=E7RCN6_9BACL|nr:ABC transporter permease subunit [Planococcus donghaensis]EGA91401.1 hypothetical protein GPDM_01000 [Planococcus donghaensis MPA1U2]